MKVLIGDISALDYWCQAGSRGWKRPERTRMRSLQAFSTRKEAVALLGDSKRELFTNNLDCKLQLVVSSASRRVRQNGVTSHAITKTLPEGSIYRLAEGIFIASPEWCLAGIMSRLDYIQAISLADEFCGTYMRDSSATGGFNRTVPLTTSARIKAYFNRYSSRHRSRFSYIVDHVVDNSNSPQETALEMMLCLPRRQSGYALPKPVMNKRIELTAAARAVAKRRYLVPDLYWEVDISSRTSSHQAERAKNRSHGTRPSTPSELPRDRSELASEEYPCDHIGRASAARAHGQPSSQHRQTCPPVTANPQTHITRKEPSKLLRVCMEYDSMAHHSNPHAMNRDKRKIDALSLLGYVVIPIDANLMNDLYAFDKVARGLRRLFKLRAFKETAASMTLRAEFCETLLRESGSNRNPYARPW